MKLKFQKLMIGGKYQKLNGKFIKSIGYFAYDGCHKIYILDSKDDIDAALEVGYYLYPIETIRNTYEKSCYLKFIDTWTFGNYYVKQGCVAKWGEVNAPKKDIEERHND